MAGNCYIWLNKPVGAPSGPTLLKFVLLPNERSWPLLLARCLWSACIGGEVLLVAAGRKLQAPAGLGSSPRPMDRYIWLNKLVGVPSGPTLLLFLLLP